MNMENTDQVDGLQGFPLPGQQYAQPPGLFQGQPPPPPGMDEALESNPEPEEDDDRDSEFYDDDGDNDDVDGAYPWQPIAEDTSEAHPDEIQYATNKGEHSGYDFDYWGWKTFESLDDPELLPGAFGRIDWVAEGFNGTQENPNKETVMRSHTVNIGGYDWQMKLYPKGCNSDYLSVYVENVTMKQQDWQAEEEFGSPPFPVLPGSTPFLKRRSVAAQIGVLMFNPEEPRTNHFQRDAHQYHKDYLNYGWPRFTSEPRRTFHFRKHGERKAILQNDKLAFSVYIRLVEDPTGSMWDHSSKSFGKTVAKTGLASIAGQNGRLSARLAAAIPLMHFRSFRDIVDKVQRKWLNVRDLEPTALIRHMSDPQVVALVTEYYPLLFQMLHRSPTSESSSLAQFGDLDVVTSTTRLLAKLFTATYSIGSEPDFSNNVVEGFGTWTPKECAVAQYRLCTRQYPSTQSALDAVGQLDTLGLIPLEFQRRQFDHIARKWCKITNKVEMNDRVMVQGFPAFPLKNVAANKPPPVPYVLYAFVTHIGNDLSAENYATYIRPQGPGKLWYCYKAGAVTALTHRQAVGTYSGYDAVAGLNNLTAAGSTGPLLPGPSTSAQDNEVAYLAYYFREDFAAYQFDTPAYEPSAVISPSQALARERTSDHHTAPHLSVGGMLDKGTLIAQVREEMNEDGEPFGKLTPDGDRAISDSDLDVVNALWTQAAATPQGDEHGFEPGTPEERAAILDKIKGAEKMQREYAKVSLRSGPPAQDKPLYTVRDVFATEFYQGECMGSKYEGEGRLITMDGNEYTGDFVQGMFHGHGKMIYAKTGDVHTGFWQCGERQGPGSYTCSATGDVWEGTWKDDKMVGKYVMRGTVQAEGEEEYTCRVCYTNNSDTVFTGCGHTNVCGECARRIAKCPVCANPIVGRVKVYGAQIRWAEG